MTPFSPPAGKVVASGGIGYPNRAGGHSVEMFDWLKFLEFAKHHCKQR